MLRRLLGNGFLFDLIKTCFFDCLDLSYLLTTLKGTWLFCVLIQGVNQGPKNKVPGVGTATVNLAEFASAAEQKEFELRLPLMVSAGVAEPRPLLCVCCAFEFLPISILPDFLKIILLHI